MLTKNKKQKKNGFVYFCVGVILQNASRVGKLAFTFTYPFLKNYVSGEMQAKGFPLVMLLRASQGAVIVCSKVPTENKEKKYEERWGCFLENQ